jgi:hypothetical protein
MVGMSGFETVSSGPRKDQAQVVGRHRDALDEIESMPIGNGANIAEVAHARGRIIGLQARVEGRVARRRMTAILLEGPIEIEDAAGREQAAGPAISPASTVTGAM